MKLFYCTILFNITLAFSQQEASVWYFGQNAGIKFENNGAITTLTDGQLNTSEGCATLADSNGELLLYTDGITVWNKNHMVMPNGTGLLGTDSSTQSATIVPMPGSATLFYIFTLDAYAGVNGFRYSIVDMTLDGGNGAVTTKNVLIYTPSCEKLAIVKHANGTDYWIVTHGWNNNTFYSYLLTSAGLSSTAVETNIGAVVSGITDNVWGYMKISPNGNKLVICNSSLSAELFDFDVITGVLSNSITLYTPNDGFVYGAEFSPNSNLLYLSIINSNPYGAIINQYDLSSVDIINTAQTVYSIYNTIGFVSALQLAPNNKIYFTEFAKPFLGAINNPNALGSACTIQVDAVDLSGRFCYLGLPPFVSSFFFTPAIQFDNSCVGENIQFQFNSSQPVLSALWDFGDGFTSSAISPSHTYTAIGNYTVSVQVTTALGSGSNTRDITISAVPTATPPNAILICDTNNDGFFNFDLTQNTTAILNGQSPTEFAVRYYANATDYANKTVITTPTSYQNLVAYQAQTIVAEVYNLANNNCTATTTFNIQVFETPTPASVVPAIRVCDDTSFGTIHDNRIVFDLTQNETTILNGQSATSFTVNYYTDASHTNMIVNPNNYVNSTAVEIIYVQVTTNLNTNCVGTTSFEIEVYATPVINSPVTLKQCDDDNDGFSAFNLTETENLIIANATGLTVAYFETLNEAQDNSNPITNVIAYTNQTVSTDIVYVRVTNANACYSVSELNLVVSTTQISSAIQETFTECDDLASGSNTDGIATFDFSSANAQIVAQYPSGQLLDITYYRNLADALAEQNAIVAISNYTNIGYPNSQDIYVRVDSRLNNECLGLGHHITLNVERIPIVQPLNYNHCDDNQDGLYAFDTTNLQSNLLNGLTNVAVTYFDALGNPVTMTNPFITASQVLTVRVTNTTPTACFYETIIAFTVDDLPEAFSIPTSWTTVCDDEVNPSLQDGLYAFDTSSFQSTILGTQTGMQVMYYDANGNALSSPLPNPFVSSTQNVTVEVINPINTTCTASTTIPFVIYPVPEIELQGDGLVCSDNATFSLDIDAGLLDANTQNNYTYQWYLNATVLPNETNYSLTVNTEGAYTVTVTNSNNCSRTRTIIVAASDIATITAVVVTDLSENNSILVLVSGEGAYEYSLDNSTYQSSNMFANLEAGIYTVYVNDIYGCGVATQEVSILGVPKFFTPNGDGFNDSWNIQGVTAQLNAKTIISIFDRYGKLLKQISPLSQGWDGLFNGQQMPSTDYWYAINLEDGRTVKGHFALKR